MLQRRLPVPLVRVGYRIAYRVAQLAWFVVRPDVHGVKGILRDGDRVLLVRHTYGDRGRWDVPGGHAHAGEPPVDAVRREMHEELGLVLDWDHVGSIGASSDHKVERVHCFVADAARRRAAARARRDRRGAVVPARRAAGADRASSPCGRSPFSVERGVQRHARDERELAALALEHVVPEVVGAGAEQLVGERMLDDDPALVLQLALRADPVPSPRTRRRPGRGASRCRRARGPRRPGRSRCRP